MILKSMETTQVKTGLFGLILSVKRQGSGERTSHGAGDPLTVV